jgi:hypothetical protein
MRVAASMTGLPLRTLSLMAIRGQIPGAAKLGSCWTFNHAALREWIAAGSVPRQAPSIEKKEIDEAYERLFRVRTKTAAR